MHKDEVEEMNNYTIQRRKRYKKIIASHNFLNVEYDFVHQIALSCHNFEKFAITVAKNGLKNFHAFWLYLLRYVTEKSYRDKNQICLLEPFLPLKGICCIDYTCFTCLKKYL